MLLSPHSGLRLVKFWPLLILLLGVNGFGGLSSTTPSGSINLQTQVAGVLPMANGGTNKILSANNGGVCYSDTDSFELLAPGTSGQLFRTNGAGAPSWTTATYPSTAGTSGTLLTSNGTNIVNTTATYPSTAGTAGTILRSDGTNLVNTTATYPATTTINQILYSSAANTVTGLATVNTGALVTSNTGVPSLASGSTANRLLRTTGTVVSFAQANLTTDVTGTLPYAQGGLGATSFPVNRIFFSNGSNAVSDANFLYATATTRFSVGGVASARIASVVSSGSDLGMQSYCEGTNNCMQIRNNAAYNLALLTANDANTTGVLVGAERSRGTQTTRTQSLTNDIGLNLVGSCYTGSASSTGFTAAIQYVQSENCTASANGGEMVFYTTPNTTTAAIERMRIKQSGEVTLVNTHLKSTQTTVPTATVNANAGTLATCTVANATDIAGKINLTTTAVAPAAGVQCTVNFNVAYAVAPICTVTPASANAASFAVANGVYFTTTTAGLLVNYVNADAVGHANTWMYHCIETQ